MGLLDKFIKPKSKKSKEKPVNLKSLMSELGVTNDTVIGSYQDEERPDAIDIDTYIAMQENDGTVKAVTRLFSIPIQATQMRVIASDNDSGERDFIETVFLKSYGVGGMSRPISFVIADMCRAIFEGFRSYEKVYQVIETGPYAGKIGLQKIAPRDARTVKIIVDEFGGFNGLAQKATFGSKYIDTQIAKEKCMIYTFQPEKHPLYGESILKTAYYHWDKKHKLYYLAHKKAEFDAIGLKILKLNKVISGSELTAAETAVDDIGFNSRVTIPAGLDLEIDRSTSNFDILSLIEHHDTQIVLSTLAQAVQMGTKSKYAYTYGSGYTSQSEFVLMTLNAIMRGMEETLNQWAVAPLIDYNFGTGNYPKLVFMPLQDEARNKILDIFTKVLQKDPTIATPEFISQLTKEAGTVLGFPDPSFVSGAQKAFERGKKKQADAKKVPAPATPKDVKNSLARRAMEMQDDPRMLEKMELLGIDFVNDSIKKGLIQTNI